MSFFAFLSSWKTASSISNHYESLLINEVFRRSLENSQYLAKENTELVSIKMLVIFFHELFYEILFILFISGYKDTQSLLLQLVVLLGLFQIERVVEWRKRLDQRIQRKIVLERARLIHSIQYFFSIAE